MNLDHPMNLITHIDPEVATLEAEIATLCEDLKEARRHEELGEVAARNKLRSYVRGRFYRALNPGWLVHVPFGPHHAPETGRKVIESYPSGVELGDEPVRTAVFVVTVELSHARTGTMVIFRGQVATVKGLQDWCSIQIRKVKALNKAWGGIDG